MTLQKLVLNETTNDVTFPYTANSAAEIQIEAK